MQVADAMKYLSHNNVIHGDLACRNVLVFRFDPSKPKYNLIKLTDFGLSKGTSMYAALRDSPSTTTLGTVPVRYAAPEVLTSDSYSEKSDVYSMGVLMWEADSKGTFPWSEIEKDEVFRRKVINGERLSQPRGCSNNMWSIILKCMSQKPEDRPCFLDILLLLTRLDFGPTSDVDLVTASLSNISLGMISYPNGSRYEGELKNGKRHGRGVMIFANGNRYEGQFSDGKRHGQGIFIYCNGRRYEGEFRNGKRNGEGTYTSSPCSRTSYSYRGEFVDDKLNGQGFAEYGNGDSYEGMFMKDKRHGQGIYVSANGDRYEGQFENGKRNGYGTFTCTNGNCYKGEFKHDKRHGQGVFTCHKGYRYEGEFKEGMHDGHGIVTYETGYRYEGTFEHNEFNDNGTTRLIDDPFPDAETVS